MISAETQAILVCLLLQHEEHGGDFLKCKDEFCEGARADMSQIILMEAKLEAILRQEAASGLS